MAPGSQIKSLAIKLFYCFHLRSKIEQSYADNLSKLAQKAQKTSKDVIG